MNETNPAAQHAPTHKPRPMIDLLVSIILPSVVLMKFSGDEHLGAVTGLMVALAFPLGWGVMEFLRYRKFNFIAILGLISVLLTGGIGLMQLDVKWLAIKEAAIPGLIGLAVLISTRTPYPLIRTLLYNPGVFNVATIQQKLDDSNARAGFEQRLLKATYWLSGTFFFSAFMNYVLAKWIVTSPAGTTAFNEELGRLTLLSYPMIAIPSMVMTMAIFYYLWRSIHDATGLTLEQMLVTESSGS